MTNDEAMIELTDLLSEVANRPPKYRAIKHAIDVLGRDKWRPIETAPKDGTAVWISYKNCIGKPRHIEALYVSKFAIPAEDWGWEDYDTAQYGDDAEVTAYVPDGWYEVIESGASPYGYFGIDGKPTHWRPLPPLPESEGL